MSHLSLSVLGSFKASLDGRSLARYRTKSVQALLIYLACQPDTAHRREHLMTLLWPGLPQKSAQANLRQTLYLLRQAIPELDNRDGGEAVPFLLVDRQQVQVNPVATIEVDLLQFEGLLDEGGTGQVEAVALYRGDFLADFYLPDSAAFEEWTLARREETRRKMLSALEELAVEALSADDYQVAAGYARRQIELDELRESAYRQLMEALARDGRRAEALTTFELLAEILMEELGAAPSPKSENLADQIRENRLVEAIETEGKIEAGKVPALPRNNLPAERTPFIGREKELSRLGDLMADPDTRLVTISGPGGMGKTRLALAAGARLLHARDEPLDESKPFRFPDGIFFVPLEALDSPLQIPPAINQALGFRPTTGEYESRRPWQQTIDYLRGKRLLLIIDNFEQLLEGVEWVVDLLEGAAQVKMLITSREKLAIQGEYLVSLQGLECPERGMAGAEADRLLTGYAAPRLFIESARRLHSNLTVVDEEGEDLIQICRLVGGIPLGLELAAGWTEIMSLGDIVAELKRGLDVLETDFRDVPERQRSMTAVFDGSWLSLHPKDQSLLSQLSVFRGGFTKEAAHQVTGATLRQLATLAGKSLIQYDQGKDRFDVHALMRQYLAIRLAADPESEKAVQDKHCAYYCQAIKLWSEDLVGAKQQQTLSRMAFETHNMQKAWSWALARRHISLMDDAADGLFMYYDLVGSQLA